MVPTRRYASLLLVTGSQDTAAQFARLLPADRFAPEYNVCSIREAGYVLAENTYDVVVIDDFIATNDGRDAALLASETGASQLLLLAAPEHFDDTAAFAQEHGYMALSSPVDPTLFRQSLGMMAAASTRIRELQEKADNLQTKMDELRIIDRAKLLLIQHFRMSEAEAHRFIEKNAMDRCLSRRTIAENIIRTYQN